MKLLKIALAASLALGVTTTTLSASPAKGQKIYTKKLKDGCGFTGDKFAVKHSQAEWEQIFKSGNLKNEIKTLCPNVNVDDVKDKWLEDLYDFAHEYANDSGNVPAC